VCEREEETERDRKKGEKENKRARERKKKWERKMKKGKIRRKKSVHTQEETEIMLACPKRGRLSRGRHKCLDARFFRRCSIEPASGRSPLTC